MTNNIKKNNKKPFFEWPKKDQKEMFFKVIDEANKAQRATIKKYEEKFSGGD
ncbi:hypothetical protein GW935_01720 [Candidatus Falkowbacteria bacterium]|nr:hypothetical protein [Candidatus Falkowbacteria bacterium]